MARQRSAKFPAKPSTTLTLRSDTKDGGGSGANSGELLFHWSSPLVIFVVTAIVRVHYVCQKRNWWLLHPDEIYQSVEVAHSEAYGYGFRPYEYMPPPHMGLDSEARHQEISRGMYSMRSFLYPRVLMVLGSIFQAFKPDLSPFLVWKTVHAVITSLLPLSVYRFVTSVYCCHTTGVTASVLVAFSVHLSVLGTHTLINSFLASFVFMTLAVIVKCTEGPGFQQKLHYSFLNKGKFKIDFTDDALLCQNYRDVQKHKAPDLCGKNENKGHKRNETNHRKIFLFFSGILVGLLVYIRIDLILFYAAVVLPLCLLNAKQWLHMSEKLVFIGFGAIIGVLAGGIDDYLCYNAFLITPIQWFKFNVESDFSSYFFGSASMHIYLNQVLLHNSAMIVLLVLMFFILALSLIHLPPQSACNHLHKTGALLISASIILVFYSAKGHKEIRFLHNFITLTLIIYGSVVQVVISWLQTKLKTLYLQVLLTVLLATYGVHQWYIFPNPQDKSNAEWCFESVWDSNHINECLDYVGAQNDVNGVFLDRTIHMTGGYTVLHKNVPLISLIHYEFYEFGVDARISLAPMYLSNLERKPSLSVLSSISNYISIYNTQYLLKLLVAKKEYNYLILKSTRKFLKVGYKEVFRSGTMIVVKRTKEESHEQKLQSIMEKIPIGSNSTVLQYEASWLLTFQRYHLAKERLLAALVLDKDKLGLLQLLSVTYSKLGENDKAYKIQMMCQQIHGHTCFKPIQRVRLHSEYDHLS